MQQSAREVDENEVRFFDSLSRTDIDLVKSKKDDDKNPVNVNAINSDGKTAPEIKAENRDFALMDERDKLLAAEEDDSKSFLLQCVAQNDLEGVKVFLSKNPDYKVSIYYL